MCVGNGGIIYINGGRGGDNEGETVQNLVENIEKKKIS